VALGVVAGAFDGYPSCRAGDAFLAPLPLLTMGGTWLGANVSVVPTIRDRFDGALAIHLELRVW
jgi:hypothetical protein